jgi:hypothetical protein
MATQNPQDQKLLDAHEVLANNARETRKKRFLDYASAHPGTVSPSETLAAPTTFTYPIDFSYLGFFFEGTLTVRFFSPGSSTALAVFTAPLSGLLLTPAEGSGQGSASMNVDVTTLIGSQARCSVALFGITTIEWSSVANGEPLGSATATAIGIGGGFGSGTGTFSKPS